jgi:hypothetical protein
MYDLTETKTGNLTTWAADINAAHHAAMGHTADAVAYAMQAGALLVQAKQKLSHGEFGPWLEANCEVSARQARRYMAAAQGKPLPVRTIAAPVKTDTVAVFKIRLGEAVTLKTETGGWIDELQILPSTHSGFFHYLFTSGQEGGGCSATYSRRPIPTSFVPRMVSQEMPDWEFADITRVKHDGLEYNVFGVSADGTEWIGRPPWAAKCESEPLDVEA